MDEEILALRERLLEATNNVASYALAARQYKLRAEAAEARVAELQHALLGRNERVRELEARELWQQASEDDPGPIATAPLLQEVDVEVVREAVDHEPEPHEIDQAIGSLTVRLAGQETANASLRARVTELLEQRDEYRARISAPELPQDELPSVRDLRVRAEAAEERVADLERALATLHATTTKGGSF